MIPCMVPAEAKDRRTHRTWMPGRKKGAAAKGKHRKLSIRQFNRAILLCSKDAGPCITQTWTDIGILIQAAVQMAHIDLNIGMGLSETLQTFRSRNDAHEFNMLSAMLLDEINCFRAGTASAVSTASELKIPISACGARTITLHITAV